MPHKCTRCENIFKDGATVILNGCPNCGWNKFLYVRDAAVPGAGRGDAQPAKKFLKEIDEIIADHGARVEKTETQQPKPDEDRIESVRIIGPGSYELNLEALLDRKEIIMSLKEDGTYMVHLPSIFENRKKGKK